MKLKITTSERFESRCEDTKLVPVPQKEGHLYCSLLKIGV